MNYTIELNNARKDDLAFSGKFTAKSPVVEIFSAMTQGKDLTPYGKKADEAAKYIMGLAQKAENGDFGAVAELNTLRKFAIEPTLLQEMKLLSVFGSYKAVGWNDTIEIESYKHISVKGEQQAEGVDVPFAAIKSEKYQITPVTISGGYAVNYRQIAVGDMSKENEGMEEVRKMIRTKATLYVIKTVFDAIENATGVKYFYESAGLVKSNVDELLTKIRRFGKPNVAGDYAVLSQFLPWLGYNGTTPVVTGVSQKLLDEIADTGLVGMYNGCALQEIVNPYNLYEVKNGNYEPLMPAGLAIVTPQGGSTSAIQTFTQGGLTSFTGNSVTTGDVLTRFDLAVAADVVKGREYEVGIIHDTNLDDL